jgi:cell wall-associated NlpC family hydrolase
MNMPVTAPSGAARHLPHCVGEEEQRARVIAEARTWLGTPFRNCADVKGAGVDCAMLLLRCFADTGVIEPFDPRPYPPQWHLHHSEERFLDLIGKFAAEVERAPVPGDVIVYQSGRCFAHGALVVENNHIIHAYYVDRKVVERPMWDPMLAQLPNGRPRPKKIFDRWKRQSTRPWLAAACRSSLDHWQQVTELTEPARMDGTIACLEGKN